MDEEKKYQTIKELIEQGGNKNRAARKLGCTRRSIDRYINGYKAYGKNFFLHGNRNRKPAHTISASVKDTIVDLYLR